MKRAAIHAPFPRLTLSLLSPCISHIQIVEVLRPRRNYDFMVASHCLTFSQNQIFTARLYAVRKKHNIIWWSENILTEMGKLYVMFPFKKCILCHKYFRYLIKFHHCGQNPSIIKRAKFHILIAVVDIVGYFCYIINFSADRVCVTWKINFIAS